MEDIRIKIPAGDWLSLVGPPGADGANAVLPEAVFASVYRATNLTVVDGASALAIPFSTEILDSDAVWVSGSPTRFTIPTAGMYLIHTQVSISALGNGEFLIMVYKNGVEQFRFSPVVFGGGGGFPSYHATTVLLSCAVSDYVEIFVSWDSGADLTVLGGINRTLFQIHSLVASSVELTGGGAASLPMIEHGIVGAAKTINWADADKHLITLDVNCTLTFSNPTSGHSYVLLVAQDSAGGNILIWPSNVIWPWAARPDETLIGFRIDLYTFIWVPSLSVYLGSYNSNYLVS